MDIKKKILSRYKYLSADKTILEYITAVCEQIIESEGSIDKSYWISIDQLTECFILYRKATNELLKDSLSKESYFGNQKNPLFQIQQSYLNQIRNILKDFGLTRSSKAKIGNLNYRAGNNSLFNADDFLDNLTKPLN